MSYDMHLTKAYDKNKQAFINTHNGHSQLVSAIKKLERKVAHEQIRPRASKILRIAVSAEETHIKTPSLARLGCLTIVNDAAQSIAPCMFFFVGEQSKIPPGQQTAACAAVLAVRGELGW